ncbi:MAG: hypothetical protein ABR510_05775 [Trueperaceae bacterium]
MNARLALLAVALGLAGFALVEVAGRARGVLTALTPSLAADAAVFAVATLLLAWAFAPWFRRMKRWALPFAVLVFVLSFAPVAAVLGAVVGLTLEGAWGVAAQVRGAFVNTPLNLIYALTLDLGVFALPAGLVAGALVALAARRPRDSVLR